MSSINKVIIIGNCVRDPEIRTMNNGKRVASFSIATSERWKDKATGERKEKAEFHNVIVYSEGLVNVVESYVKKGSKLYVEGALQTRKWQDQSGNDKYTTEIVLQGFKSQLALLGGKDDTGAGSQVDTSDMSPEQRAALAQNFGVSANQHSVVKQDVAVDQELDDEIPF